MPLEDDSAMPFGKFKGEEMQDVPARYLLWLYDQKTCTQDVKDYIQENREILVMELRRENAF